MITNRQKTILENYIKKVVKNTLNEQTDISSMSDEELLNYFKNSDIVLNTRKKIKELYSKNIKLETVYNLKNNLIFNFTFSPKFQKNMIFKKLTSEFEKEIKYFYGEVYYDSFGLKVPISEIEK